MAKEEDVSPQSEATGEAATAAAADAAPGDGYGSATAAADTVVVRVFPPKPGRLTRVNAWIYDNGATAHTITMLVPIQKVQSSTDAAAAQAVIKLKENPTNLSGLAIAANDWLVVKDEKGIFGAYRVSSVSGLSITIATSIGAAGASGFVNKILADTPVWYFGAPSEHATRQYTMKASVVTTMPYTESGWATSPAKNEPIIMHDNNATAAGIIVGVSYSNPKV